MNVEAFRTRLLHAMPVDQEFSTAEVADRLGGGVVAAVRVPRAAGSRGRADRRAPRAQEALRPVAKQAARHGV